MPKGLFFSPGSLLFTLIVVGVMSLFSRSKKRPAQYSSPKSSSPLPAEAEANVDAMKKIVEKYDGYTAEVIEIRVFGRRRVDTFRLLSPGSKVDLRMKKGDIKVFVFGEYISELITPATSYLPRLFEEDIPFDAYLGGRDRAFLYDNTIDICSIIVFYKLDGVPPTQVNLF